MISVIGFNFICEAPDRDSDGNRQENPPEYYHSVCGDSDGLVLRTVLGCARKRNLHLRIQMSEAEDYLIIQLSILRVSPLKLTPTLIIVLESIAKGRGYSLDSI